jgi:hypothetical protein
VSEPLRDAPDIFFQAAERPREGELNLYGMKAAFDEIMATAVKRQHEPQRIVGDLTNGRASSTIPR